MLKKTAAKREQDDWEHPSLNFLYCSETILALASHFEEESSQVSISIDCFIIITISIVIVVVIA